MSDNNRKLTEFTKESSQRTEDDQSEQNDPVENRNTSITDKIGPQKNTDGSFVCDTYIEMKNKYKDKLN